MDKQLFGRLFPLGSHLCREPMPPMAELKRDMENLKRHGFNLIKLQEHWGVDEPLEGHYDFSRYEELIEHAAGLDMGIYLGLTCEQAPNWLWVKHPGCRMVGKNGALIPYQAQSTLPADGKPGPCYDHPGAQADQSRFIKRLVKTLGRYENVVCWNTWQEIGYWPQGLVGTDVCYCAHTIEHFRRWLSEKYGDLDGLNRAWNTRYLDWLYVLPDRGEARIPQAQNVDWRHFMDHVQIGGVLAGRVQAIREADPEGRWVFAHRGAPSFGSGVDWTYARIHDFVGSSCYPAWHPLQSWDDGAPSGGQDPERRAALVSEAHSGVAYYYDYVRSFNVPGAPVWAAEFQGGPVSTGLQKGRVPSAEDVRRWMLTAVSCGVTAISFWVTRAEIMAAETNGFSLLDSAGDSTPRLEEAARVGRALNEHADLFGTPSWGGADVGILINDWNYQFCMTLSEGGEHLPYSVRGWHRLLWESGIPSDFVEVAYLDEETMGQYEALVLPFPISLSAEAADRLARYVELGGNLISEACPGRLDEHAYANRGELSPTMAALFGVEHESLTLVREPDGGSRWSPVARTWGEYAPPTMLEGTGPLKGLSLRANLYVETFAPIDAKPILSYGDKVAGTTRAFGGGKAMLLGTLAGHNGTAYSDQRTRACLLALLEQCGVKPLGQDKLAQRRRVSGKKEAWFFTNLSEEDVTEAVDVTGFTSVEDLLGEPLQRQGNTVRLRVRALDVRVLVLRSE